MNQAKKEERSSSADRGSGNRTFGKAERAAVQATVLVADDDARMRALVSRALTAGGYNVIGAHDGRELLDFIATGILRRDRIHADVIVSDVRMPGWSGLEVLRGLRRAKWTTPVILITAFGDRELHEEARRLGAACVLNKPFELSDLTRAVGAIVAPIRP